MRTAHLFAGAGGGLLADLILGHVPVLAIERDANRCALLRHRYPELAVAEGDCRTMDFTAWRGRVDVLHAGIPCPKWSTARRGVGDPADLRPEVVRICGEIRPTILFVECVPGFIREHVSFSEALEEIGYTLSRPLVLDAARVGAPHSRKRYWAAGYADQKGEPVVPIHAEVAELPPPDSSPWEVDPSRLQVADGLADRWEMECAGDGQNPLQCAIAQKMLGVP